MNKWHVSKVGQPLLGSAAGLCVCFGAVDQSFALDAPLVVVSEKSAAAQAVWLDALLTRTNPFLAVPVVSGSAAFQPVNNGSGAFTSALMPLSTALNGSSPAATEPIRSFSANYFSAAMTAGVASSGAPAAITAINPPPAAPPGAENNPSVTAAPSKRPKPPKPPKPPKASR